VREDVELQQMAIGNVLIVFGPKFQGQVFEEILLWKWW
jgi:hypothetical protein